MDSNGVWVGWDSIHVFGHGSNPGRCKKVCTLPMSYHCKLVIRPKICLTDLQRPSLGPKGPGFDPCTWTWIESWQMQNSVHFTNELS